MRNPNETPTHVLVTTVTEKIDDMLNEAFRLPPLAHHLTDHTDASTGFTGVSAHLYTSHEVKGGVRNMNLQVMGPDSLISHIAARYENYYKIWAREPGKLLFTIRG